MLAVLFVAVTCRAALSAPPSDATPIGSRYSYESGVIVQDTEVLADVRVHGNAATPDDEIIRLAGVVVGSPLTSDTPAQVQQRLEASKRFERVEVLKRFASIADPSQILLVIVVDEGPVTITGEGASARIVRGGSRLLFIPVLDHEDGYGVTFGVRAALPDPFGKRSRLSVPLTLGGTKEAGIALEKAFDGGPVSRVAVSASLTRRTNPFYEADDDRRQLGIRAERDFGPSVKIGGEVSFNGASLLGSDGRFVDAGVDVTADTRLDPMLSRNAVYGRVSWDRLRFSNGETIGRTTLEGRGYIGFIGQSIVVLRAIREASDSPLPPYLQPLLGGMENLRGFKAGYAAGDTLVAGSAELRIPLTSPLSIGKFGVDGFVDMGTVYPHGERLADQTLKRGVGGGIWFSATVIHLNLAVAHGIGASTRVHFGTTVTF